MMVVLRGGPQGPNWSRREILAACLVFLVSRWLPFTSAQRPGRSYACGAPRGANVTYAGISWESDADIAPQGSNVTKVGLEQYIRYFSAYSVSNPQQNLHCYDKLLEEQYEGPLLLIATFNYANYDGLDQAPEFKMWVGTAEVAYVNLKKDDLWIEEVILSPKEDRSKQVFCLVAVKGAPVISFIELRPLPANSYSAEGRLLRKKFRIDCGNTVRSWRYPDDHYDRKWDTDSHFSDASSGITVTGMDGEDVPERPPVAVLETARDPSAGADVEYILPVDTSGSFSVILYTPSNITVDAQVNAISETKHSASGKAIRVSTFSGVPDSAGTIDIVLRETEGQAPQINALEVYQEINSTVPSLDLVTLNNIHSYYNLRLKWVGDPCLPVPWEGLQCSSDNRVTSLDLSGQNIVEPVLALDIVYLDRLTHLNLSFNSFNQEIPNFSGLDKLEVLDLRRNDFFGTLDALTGLPSLTQLFVSFNRRLSGEIPVSLRRRNVFIDVQGTCVGEGTNCSVSPTPALPSSRRKSNNTGAIIGGIVAAVLAVLIILGLGIFFTCRRPKAKAQSGYVVEGGNEDLRNWSAARVFTFKELEVATQYFKKQLGEGSFGPVYYGVLSNGMKVAIKMRHDTSQLGAEAFANEVYLLSRVHHPNLVPLLGYCQEGKNQLLVYEYMPGGTLMDHLYGATSRLDWVARLRIAIGAATGISYLHNGSDPKIIHRDVKSSNILLSSNMTAKVSDFGLSKLVMKTGATHVTTLVKGTAGYLDPEYFTTNQLTEKSDVYSFGVVLLEIICGREPLTSNRAPDEYNLLAWAKPYLLAKTYEKIVDTGLENNYNALSISLVANLALRCVERDGENRPTMLQVLRELEEALSLEDRVESSIPSSSQSNSGLYAAAFDFKSTASDTPPDSAPQLAHVPSFTFPR